MKIKGSITSMVLNVNDSQSHMRVEVNGVVHEASGSADEVMKKFNEAIAKTFGPPAIEGKPSGK